MSELLSAESTTELPAVLVGRSGRVLKTFDHRTQDSGNVSWLVETAYETFFVKTAGTLAAPPQGAPVPYFDHAGRVELLRNAVELARSCDHPCLAPLRNVVESPIGPVLVYDYAPGELVGTSRGRRGDPTSAYQRFASLPAGQLLRYFDAIVDLHRQLAEADYVACDLYDGCLLVDFGTDRLTVVDLDNYRRGSGTNTMGRMFGSTRFMAPEEFVLGAPIDQRTTVFTLGRLVWHFATRLTEAADRFCGSAGLQAVVERATAASPAERFGSVRALAVAWQEAR